MLSQYHILRFATGKYVLRRLEVGDNGLRLCPMAFPSQLLKQSLDFVRRCCPPRRRNNVTQNLNSV